MGIRLDLQRQLAKKKRQRILKLAFLAFLGFILGSLLLNVALRLPVNASKPIDAIFVLGGSIRREIYAANLTKEYPEIPILISQGSKDPCIWKIFQQRQARLNHVWLEKCADSTFGNFFFGIPILHRWGTHKVLLVTSPSHLPRAKWLGQILLGSHGMWVELDIVKEKGVPGNREFALKTGLDVTRSLFWALLSQIIHPPCFDVIQLADMDLQTWQEQGYQCERQGKVGKAFR